MLTRQQRVRHEIQRPRHSWAEMLSIAGSIFSILSFFTSFAAVRQATFGIVAGRYAVSGTRPAAAWWPFSILAFSVCLLLFQMARARAPQQRSRRALFTAAAVASAISAGLLFLQIRPPQSRAGELVVGLARLEGSSQNDLMNRVLYEGLARSVSDDPGVFLRPLDESFSDSARALAAAKAAGVDLMLWGAYRASETSVWYSVKYTWLRAAPFAEDSRPTPERVEVVTAPILEFNDFSVQQRLAERLSYFTYLTLGSLRAVAGERGKAISAFRLALRSGSANLEDCACYVRFSLAATLADDGQAREALDAAEDLLRRSPGLAAGYFVRGVANERLGRNDLALQDYDRALSGELTDAAVGVDRGEVALRKAKLLALKEDYAGVVGALAILPSEASRRLAAVLDLAWAHRQLGDYARAIAAYDEAVSMDVSRPEPLIGRGNSRYYISDFLGSIQDYTKAIDIQPQNGMYYFNRANAYAEVADIVNAEVDYSTARRLGFKEARVYHRWGEALVTHGRPQDGLPFLSQSIMAGGSIDAHLAMGIGLVLVERYRDALSELDGVVTWIETPRTKPASETPEQWRRCLCRNDGRAYYWRALALVRLGSLERAAVDLEKVLSSASSESLKHDAGEQLAAIRMAGRRPPGA